MQAKLKTVSAVSGFRAAQVTHDSRLSKVTKQ
jgi:hypothetical protein